VIRNSRTKQINTPHAIAMNRQINTPHTIAMNRQINTPHTIAMNRQINTPHTIAMNRQMNSLVHSSFYVLNFVLPACRPHFVEFARTTNKAEQA